MSLRSSSPSSQQSSSTSYQSRKMKRRGGIVCNSSSLPEKNVNSSAPPSSEGGSQRRLAYCCDATLNKDAQKVRLSLDQSIRFEPESMDIVFDRQGKVVDDQEGNLRFRQLISSYYADRYHYANTTTHRSLVRIEFLDELKSLGVRLWKRTSVQCVAVYDNEKDTYDKSSSYLYSPMNDARALRRIRDAFETEAIRKSIGRKLSNLSFSSSGESGLRWSSISETSDGTPLIEA
eukprot:CAMPEP_0194113752 /NCGR_PEP_ID=MMETSP0150-20130528/17699_1 /TAXON_ID=122233 /ORGANISM="Chaetoceros debilis, Strain MM31A-1" /LENGTH=232 /DNA_ID=CAMNT_0038803765 /DNA_START=33 /DNA_END=731 /DNA_ORIENTATION=-